MSIKKLFLPSCLALTFLHAQSTVGFDVNNKDFEVLASIDLNTFADYTAGITYLLDASYLYADGDDLGTIGLGAQNSFEGLEGLAFAFGAKFVFTDDFTALPLFGKAIYTLPLGGSIPSTSLSASFAYSPEVLTFSDGKHYTEFRAEADMEIVSNFHLFAGYRNMDTEYITYDKTFNDSFYGGMKLGF
ncbi:YfaZ family outer membrane protein [Sulfurovum sp.]|uniref:YfaZ family outer membrane protein n=1 Tax=Sulfurovum sp. TaxID=1969726 RepID=UPI0028681322|nr:YfaZ family outer membrane protein [Sulfurovum sp.]